MRVKLLDDRSQTDFKVQLLFSVFVYCFADFSLLYFCQKSKWFFGFFYIFFTVEFSTIVDKFPVILPNKFALIFV